MTANLDQESKQKFIEIVTLLEEYDAQPKNLIKKQLTENAIAGLLEYITLDGELFWEIMTWNKDIMSYRFNSRTFPKFTIDDNVVKKEVNYQTPENPEIPENPKSSENENDPHGEVANKDTYIKLFRTRRAEILQNIKNRYDVRDTIRKTLNSNYVDEGAQDKPEEIPVDKSIKDRYNPYQSLPISEYYRTISQDTMIHIFQLCHKNRLYTAMLGMFCNMVTNKLYCHLVLHEKILELMFNPNLSLVAGGNPFTEPDYIELLHYVIFYGLYILYREECISKATTNLAHRFVFSLQTAAKLPLYHGSLENNPYVTLTLSRDLLKATAVPDQDYIIKPIRTAPGNRGLYSLWSFKERFRIFTDGIFEGMPLDKITFGGSVLPACSTRNPLENLFYKPIPVNQDMIFDEEVLPPDSSQDGTPAYQKYITFMNRLSNLKSYWQEHSTGLQNYFDEYYPSKRVLIPEKSYNDPNVNIALLEDSLSDIDIMVDVLDDQDFDRIAMDIVRFIKRRLQERHPDIKVGNNELQLIKISTRKSYKYYVSGSLMPRSLEIFRLFGAHPIGGVSRFHFPAVRGIYTGRDVYILPSHISYAYTGLFLDYKWMSSAKDTKSLILKYWLRGGVCILNAREHQILKQYVDSNPGQWSTILKYATTDRYISINSPVFRPSLNPSGFYCNILDTLKDQGGSACLIPRPPSLYVDEDYKFQEQWEKNVCTSRHGFPLEIRFGSGHIQVPYHWKIRAYMSSLSRSKKYNSEI